MFYLPVLNLFALNLLERFTGLSYTQLVSEATGLTERTWRNRARSNWQPTSEEITALSVKTHGIVIGRLTKELEYDRVEAASILEQLPPGHYYCSQLLAICTMPHYRVYSGTRLFLNAVDGLSDRLAELRRADEIGAFKDALLTSEILTTEHWKGADNNDATLWRERVRVARSWEDLDFPLQVVTANIAFSMFAQWDLEFNETYFKGEYGSYPLFALVLPRLSRNVFHDAETGVFMRGKKTARRNLFLTSTARLLELVAVLIHFRDRGRWPYKVPKVKEMAVLFGEVPSIISSWRDETTIFSRRDLDRIWLHGVAQEFRMGLPVSGIPSSFLAASTLFKDLVVRKGDRVQEVHLAIPEYIKWWRSHAAATCTIHPESARASPFAELLS